MSNCIRFQTSFLLFMIELLREILRKIVGLPVNLNVKKKPKAHGRQIIKKRASFQ